jgi:hypothetical protein
MVVQTCNPSYLRGGQRLRVWLVNASQGKKFVRPQLNQRLVQGNKPVNPKRSEKFKQKIMVQAWSDKKQDPISKVTHEKRAGRVAQVVEHLPGEHKALSSTSSTIYIYKMW